MGKERSARSLYLLSKVPVLPSDVVVGRCHHSCEVQVNMGTKDPERIGMRYHFVSAWVLLSHDPKIQTPPLSAALAGSW
jgi:hypothetical protein